MAPARTSPGDGEGNHLATLLEIIIRDLQIMRTMIDNSISGLADAVVVFKRRDEEPADE
jgi:hypothetical protein